MQMTPTPIPSSYKSPLANAHIVPCGEPTQKAYFVRETSNAHNGNSPYNFRIKIPRCLLLSHYRAKSRQTHVGLRMLVLLLSTLGVLGPTSHRGLIPL